MKNGDCFAERDPQQEELKDVLTGLNDVYLEAFVTVMRGLTQGKSFEEAVEDGNKILVANGKNPVPYPFPLV